MLKLDLEVISKLNCAKRHAIFRVFFSAYSSTTELILPETSRGKPYMAMKVSPMVMYIHTVHKWFCNIVDEITWATKKLSFVHLTCFKCRIPRGGESVHKPTGGLVVFFRV